MNVDGAITIGALASETGASVSALRYYDSVGLIAPSGRVGGKRRFDTASVGRVNFIRGAQRVGFTLDEVREILDDNSGRWTEQVDGKLRSLRERRAEIDTMISTLEEVRRCGCEAVAACPRMLGSTPSP